MNKFLFLYLLTTFTTLPALAKPVKATSDSFCVQTINMHGTAFASNTSGRLKILADTTLADMPCAAYHIQEIWMEGDYDYFVGLMNSASLHFTYADRIRPDGSRIGLASAYPGSVLRIRSELYEVNNGTFGIEKGFLLANVRIPSGQEVFFWNTHMNPRSNANRVAQAIQTVDLFLTKEPRTLELPLMLTGDLNDYPNSTALLVLQKVLLLKDSFMVANGTYRGICTFCKDNPENGGNKDEILDYVLYRSAPGLGLSATKSEINLKNGVSDHYGVRSTFRTATRNPELLPENDPLVQSRKREAIAALQKAQRQLAKDSSGEIEKVIQRARELEAMIRDGSLPAPTKEIFRILD